MSKQIRIVTLPEIEYPLCMLATTTPTTTTTFERTITNLRLTIKEISIRSVFVFFSAFSHFYSNLTTKERKKEREPTRKEEDVSFNCVSSSVRKQQQQRQTLKQQSNSQQAWTEPPQKQDIYLQHNTSTKKLLLLLLLLLFLHPRKLLICAVVFVALVLSSFFPVLFCLPSQSIKLCVSIPIKHLQFFNFSFRHLNVLFISIKW